MSRRRVVVYADVLERLLQAAARASASDPQLSEALAAMVGSPTEPDRALTIPEAAQRLRVSERTIRRRVADGSLPARRIGRRVLIDPEAVRSGQGRS